MWLYVPAMKQLRKDQEADIILAGTIHAVIDRLNAAVNYRIHAVGWIYEDIGSQVVHRNRQKRCYGLPREEEKEGRTVHHNLRQQDVILEAAQTIYMDPVPEDDAEDRTETHDGGYVEADNYINDEGMMDDVQAQFCLQRIRRCLNFMF